MLEFIQLLKQRYQALLPHVHNDNAKAAYQQRLDQLALAEAFVRKGQLRETSDDPVLHIAVIGPTQAGKSSLVNTLLNSSVAGVSPLAGYTAHPQGFCNGLSLAECSDVQRYFGRFQQVLPEQLSKSRYDCYALSENTALSPYLPRCVLWDTPDFDSIEAEHYREGVIRTVALADIIILAVSKEKYADQTVWDIMADIEPLHQPTVICLNKLGEGTETLVLASLKEKWHLARSDEFPAAVPLYYQKTTGLPVWPETEATLLITVAGRLAQSAKNRRLQQGRAEQALLHAHWQEWLEPVLAEQRAHADWRQMVSGILKQALSDYQRDYLNHPHHYATFQQALAELLTLLEVPGIAGFLAGTRKILTWPIRQLTGRRKKARDGNEMMILTQLVEHVLIRLADKVGERAERSVWWKEFGHLLRQHKNGVVQSGHRAAARYQSDFRREVETSARRLYQKLQEQPIVLNSLRATRATTDAAAIALALHTGGIGVQDLVLAPAMLTVTSLLTESAIGGYLHTVEADLKRRQLSAVGRLLNDDVGVPLLRLPDQLSNDTHFNITAEQVSAAETQMTEKRHGLRLL